MSQLFNQIDFRGGLDAEFGTLKLPANSYPLLVNGRVRDGNVSPVRSHVLDTARPSGNWQDVVIIGDYMVAIVSGIAYYKNLATNSHWEIISNWTALDTDVDEVYMRAVPFSPNLFNHSGDADGVDNVFNPNISPVNQCLLVTDGINQPQAIFQDLSVITLQTYAEWNLDNPIYVPLGILPVVGNGKLWLVSPDRTRILQSFTGRYLDFVINVDSDGNKAGDTYTQAYAVDFNQLTVIFPIAEGGLLASTLYATYFLLPNGKFQFGEPVLRPGEPIPVGAVNHKSFVDIIGDTAFISQAGIQSLNIVGQLKNESNNTPLSAKISRYLTSPDTNRTITQSNTAAINFDDYALFAMNTQFGRVVVVYDAVRKQFVSIDTGFGTVKKFALYRSAGVTRLFFVNTDNELYEAYAGDEYAVTRIHVGDFSANDGLQQHKVSAVTAYFTDVLGNVTARMSYFSDNAQVTTYEETIVSTSIRSAAPSIIPFVSEKETFSTRMGVQATQGYKSSVWIEWQGAAKLVGVAFEGNPVMPSPSSGGNIYTPAAPIAFVSDLGINTVAAIGSAGELISTLEVGKEYYVSGLVHIGDQIIEDNIFTAKMRSGYLNGVIYTVDTFRALLRQIRRESPTAIYTGGNSISGGEPGYQRFIKATTPETIIGAAGNQEWSTDNGLAWFQRNETFGVQHTELVDFFILSGGWTTAESAVDEDGNPGTTAEDDGVTVDSNQAKWLELQVAASTKPFKVVIVHYPPYTDGAKYPGFAPLRWDFSRLGVDLVLSGHTQGYERFYINGFPYIVCGLGGAGTGSWEEVSQRSVARFNSAAGYILLRPNRYAMDVLFKDVNGVLRDATTIYSR